MRVIIHDMQLLCNVVLRFVGGKVLGHVLPMLPQESDLDVTHCLVLTHDMICTDVARLFRTKYTTQHMLTT